MSDKNTLRSSKKKRHHRRRKKKSGCAGVVLVFLAFFVLVGGTLFVMANRMLNQIGRVDKEQEVWLRPEEVVFEPDEESAENEQKEDTVDPDTLVWTKPVDVVKDPNIKNYLLIGQDRRPGETRARSDSMIICSINEDTKQITLVSLMRDMYVPYPEDYLPTRLNHAYAWGGMSLLDRVIEENFGIKIDGNIEVDFNGFIDVMNMIAPLEINLTAYEAGYLSGGTNWGLHEGINALNGEQLLRYSRLRSVGHGDWERTERQRRVLTAAYGKVRDMGIRELMDLAEAALPCFSTDLSNSEILRTVYTVATNRMTLGETHRLPVDGTYSEEMIRGMAVLVPDLEANSGYLREYLLGNVK